MCNEVAKSIFDWISEHQTLFVFGGVATFWFIRFMIGHKLVWLRCKLRLHKFEPWDSKALDQQHANFYMTRTCNDCGMPDPRDVWLEGKVVIGESGEDYLRFVKRD